LYFISIKLKDASAIYKYCCIEIAWPVRKNYFADSKGQLKNKLN